MDASPRVCTPLAETDSPTGVGELTVLLPWWRPHLEASNLSPQTIRAYTRSPHRRDLSSGCMYRLQLGALWSTHGSGCCHFGRRGVRLPATACTAGHPAQVRTGAATSAPETSPGAQANVTTGPPPVRGAAYTSGGCGTTPLLRGPAAGWASSANPPPIRYALAERGQVAGFLFGYPLMAANPSHTRTRSSGLSLPPETVCHCGLPVIHSMPLRLSCHPPGQRIRGRGKSTVPTDLAGHSPVSAAAPNGRGLPGCLPWSGEACRS